jgi:hypothetical protein
MATLAMLVLHSGGQSVTLADVLDLKKMEKVILPPPTGSDIRMVLWEAIKLFWMSSWGKIIVCP